MKQQVRKSPPCCCRGVFIDKYAPLCLGRISADVIWGKNMKRGRRKRENLERKWKKWGKLVTKIK
jgi:hypothetical protein